MIRDPLVLVCALVGLLTASCVPAEEVPPPLERDYAAITTMGAIQERGVLRAGIPQVPLLEEFTTDLAGELARLLDVELDPIPVTPENVHVLLGNGSIDVGFPLKPLTEQVVRRNAVTDPYLISSQRILAGPGTTVEALSGAPVCITGEAPITIEIGGSVRGSIRGCAEGLRAGRFEAVSGLDVELAAVLALVEEAFESGTSGAVGGSDDSRHAEPGAPLDYRSLDITGDALSTAGLSAFVTSGASDLVAFVEQAFDEYAASGGWETAFEAAYGDVLEAEPPTLSAEEAATLFPR